MFDFEDIKKFFWDTKGIVYFDDDRPEQVKANLAEVMYYPLVVKVTKTDGTVQKYVDYYDPKWEKFFNYEEFHDFESITISGFHAALKVRCGCGADQWIMYRSKLGESELIEHRWNQLNSYNSELIPGDYGVPVFFGKPENRKL